MAKYGEDSQWGFYDQKKKTKTEKPNLCKNQISPSLRAYLGPLCYYKIVWFYQKN